MSDEFVRVPFYREANGDKTHFLPEKCRQKQGYEIGARNKDKERGIQSYWEALAKLSKMSQARFRRKNESGNFGTVTCNPADFEMVNKKHIEEQCNEHGG